MLLRVLKNQCRSYIIFKKLEIPEIIWVPFLTSILVLFAGLLSVVFKLPLLFPSLGVTALTQPHSHQRSTLSLWRKLVGGLFPVFSGYAAVFITHADSSATFVQVGYVPIQHVWASAISICLLSIFQLISKTFEPAAGATVLLISLGMFKPTFHEVISLLIGISFTIILSDIFVRFVNMLLKKKDR